jgi:hypothetical protein
LTRRANQGHFDIIAKTTRPVLKPAAGFLIGERLIEKAVLFFRNLFAAFSSNLIRRANHLHTDIIARQPAPAVAGEPFIFPK